MALSAYLTATRRLLHDAGSKYFADAELTTYINSARQRIGLDTGAISGLITFFLSASQESYPFNGAVAALTLSGGGSGYTAVPTLSFSGGGGSGVTATASIDSTNNTVSGLVITANGSGFTSAPTIAFAGGGGTGASATVSILTALDIVSITANLASATNATGGNWRTLGYWTFAAFQAQARYYRNNTGQPAIWSAGPPSGTGGGRSFYIFQVPSQSYQCDIHAITTPSALIDDTTAEPLVYPETDLIPYYAAYLAKYNQQMFEESANFLRIYDELLRRGQASKYQRRIPNPYTTGV